MAVRSRRPLRAAVLVPAVALVVAALQPGAPPAAADTVPPAGTPATVSADVLPTVQVNGVVWAQVIAGDRVYVTGDFTSARPAGAPAGTGETPRANLLAYDLRTGALVTSWAPTLNAQGLAIAASADGSRIFVGGSFTSVSGVARHRLAALDAATGAVVTGFAPAFNATVRSLAVRGTTVYAGGIFSVVANQGRGRLAAVSAATGALLPWAPTADAEVMTMTAPAGTSSVVVGGRFTLLNGAAHYGLGALDAGTGAVLPFPANQVVRNAGTSASIYSLTSGGGVVYGSGYVFGGSGGNLENTFAADAATGALRWVSGCRGDTYGTAVAGDVLYSVGHPHDCSQLAAFPQTNPWTYQRAMAQTGLGRTNTGGSFAGRPAPSLLHWLPTLAVGTHTGQDQAAWSVAADGRYVVLAGEFPSVNGTPQQGLARFATSDAAPDAQGPQGGTSMAPAVTGVAPGTVRVSFLAGWDRDNARLRYELLRGAQLGTAVVVGTQHRGSTWWDRPAMATTDRGAAPGSTATYRVRMTDPFGNVAYSATVTGTVPAGPAPAMAYRDQVAADGAVAHWRLGEASGTAHDWSGRADLTPSAGTTRGVPGAIAGDPSTAVTFPGTDAVPATTAGSAAYGPQEFSVEAWFRTTSRTGGKIVGFGNRNTAASASNDRHVYLTDGGQLVFGVYPGAVRTVTSPATYHDGRWHHVVGTLGPDGLRLYVDGAPVASRADTTSAAVYTGWWRVGGDTLGTNWTARPTSAALAGSVDEVAVYPAALPAAAVAAHHRLGTGTVPAPPPGVVAADAYDRTVADGFGSADVGGAWTADVPGSAASVAGGSGRLSVGVGRTAAVRLPGVSARDVDLVGTVWTEAAPTGGGLYHSAAVRATAAGEYRVRTRVQATGAVLVNLAKVVGGVETALGPQVTVPGPAYAAGTPLRVRVRAVGAGTTTLQARVWPAASAEPAGWLVTATDATAELQSAGAVGLVGYLSGSATAALAVRHDDLAVTRP